MAQLKVKLDCTEHGWAGVHLSSDGQEYSFLPSHVPYDSLGDLIEALLKLLDGYEEVRVRWNDEPVEHEFLFKVKDGKLNFEVYEVVDSRTERNFVKRFSHVDTVPNVVRIFWRALRLMQSKQSVKEYEEQWREPFPAGKMEELTRRIKDAN